MWVVTFVTLAYVENDRHGRRAGLYHTIFKLKKNCTVISEMFKIVVGTENGRTQVFQCFSKFKSGVISVADDECLGCTSIGKTDENVD